MKTLLKTKFLFSILVLFLAGCQYDIDSRDTAALIQEQMDLTGIPSLAACIIKNDQIVWQFISGFASREADRRASDQTSYLLASISKTVTGAAIMQLVEKGLLDLDEDISHYLPFRVRHPKYPEIIITTRMVMSHRSGLGWPANPGSSFYTTYFNDNAPPFYPWIKEFMLPGGSDYNPSIWRETAPGEKYWYSNFGVTLLGYLAEVVSGEKFRDYCRNHIFQPLNMPNTSFSIKDLQRADVAMPYENNKTPVGHYSYIYYPAACLRSSLRDYSNFLIAMMNGGVYKGTRVLGEHSINEMLTRHYPDNEVGLIWKILGEGWFEHSGSMRGVRTETEFQRETRTGIIILTNGESGIVQRGPGGVIYDLIRTESANYQ